MLYTSHTQNMLGTNIVDAYSRYVVQAPPPKMTTIAIVGGSIALVATIAIVKTYKGKRKRKKR